MTKKKVYTCRIDEIHHEMVKDYGDGSFSSGLGKLIEGNLSKIRRKLVNKLEKYKKDLNDSAPSKDK